MRDGYSWCTGKYHFSRKGILSFINYLNGLSTSTELVESKIGFP